MSSNNDNHLDETSDHSVLDEVIAEYIRACEAGQPPDRDELLAAHPDLADELREFFANRDQMDQVARPMRMLAARVLNVRCPHCHNPIELLDQAPLGDISCPSCGSSFSLVTDKTESLFPGGSEKIGHFELLEHVGIGAFGSVWKARDTKLDRTVAIKIPRRGQLNESETEMFLRDARAAAQLKHPNIAGVHEVGKHDDTIYIVSDFIHGATLKDWMTANRPTPRESAELCVKIANALHHAHEAGVIHRDLKPGNIMIERVKGQESRDKSTEDASSSPALDSGLSALDSSDSPEPHIVDFGLAKREAGEITMTVEGQILGTPAYMSPEQARGEGHQVDRRADVYSLGVILFELLTGELPFRGDKQMLIVQILNDDPPSPRKLNVNAPRDLETICLKCLEKERAKRYHDAQVLSDDFERFLLHQPIRARPVSKAGLAGRWCRRKPVVAALTCALCVAIAIGFAGITWQWRRAESEAENTRLAHEVTKQTVQKLEDEQRRNKELKQTTDELEEKRRILDESLVLRRQELYSTSLRLARAEWLAESPQTAADYLHQCPEEMRSREWSRLKRRCDPECTTLVNGNGNAKAISQNGRLLASIQGPVISVSDLSASQLLHSFSHPENKEFSAVCFSPNGVLLAACGTDQSVYLWNLESQKLEQTLATDDGRPLSDICFSGDGRRLAVASAKNIRGYVYGKVFIWDLETHTKLEAPLGFGSVQLSSNGNVVACYSRRNNSELVLQVWQVSPAGPSKSPLVTIATPRGEWALSPDGRKIAVARWGGRSGWSRLQNVVEIWNLQTKMIEQRFPFSQDSTYGIAFGSHGTRLACLLQDHYLFGQSSFAVVWSLDTGRKENMWYVGTASDFEYCADGCCVVTGEEGPDCRIRVWDVTPIPNPTDKILTVNENRAVGRYAWAQFGGSGARNNTPAGTNIPTNWDRSFSVRTESGHNLKWVATLGSQTNGNPVVANGHVYIGTNNGAGYLKRFPPSVDLGVLLCFDEVTGEFLWQHSNEVLSTKPANDSEMKGVCSTPVVDGNRMWYVSNRGEVVCLDTEGFFDAADDGPVTGELGRLFVVSKPDTTESVDQVAAALDALKEGQLNDYLRAEFAHADMPLPSEVVLVEDEAARLWSFTAKVRENDREFHLRREGANLAAYKTITADDKNEADVVWRFDMIRELGVHSHNVNNCSMITLDGMLFVCTSNGTDKSGESVPAPHAPSFVAMNRATGEVIWTDNSPGKNILPTQPGSPSYGVFDGQAQVVFPGGDGWLYSFDPKGNGEGGSKLLWKFDCNPKTSEWRFNEVSTRSSISACPAIYDGLVYATVGHEHGRGRGHLWCIDPTKRTDGSDVSSELAVDSDGKRIPHRRLQAVIPERGEQAIPNPNSAMVWHYDGHDQNGDGELTDEEWFHQSVSTPVIKDDILYVPDIASVYHCLDAKTGEPNWTYDLFTECRGSALLVDGKVYFANKHGDVTIFRHSPHRRIIGEVTMRPVHLTPIVANNVLYIATGTNLYAIQNTTENSAKVSHSSFQTQGE